MLFASASRSATKESACCGLTRTGVPRRWMPERDSADGDSGLPADDAEYIRTGDGLWVLTIAMVKEFISIKKRGRG